MTSRRSALTRSNPYLAKMAVTPAKPSIRWHRWSRIPWVCCWFSLKEYFKPLRTWLNTIFSTFFLRGDCSTRWACPFGYHSMGQSHFHNRYHSSASDSASDWSLSLLLKSTASLMVIKGISHISRTSHNCRYWKCARSRVRICHMVTVRIHTQNLKLFWRKFRLYRL